MVITAQQWLKNNYNDKTTNDDISLIDKTVGGVECEELTGQILIEDYTNTKKINFERQNAGRAAKIKGGITKVIIRNCPNLEKIDLDNNKITEIVLEGNFNKLVWLDLIDNDLTSLDIGKTPKLENLNVGNNKNIRIKGLENLDEFPLIGSPGVTAPICPKYFKVWKDAIRGFLGITGDDLPDTWQTDLTNKLGGANLANIPSGQTLASLIANYSSDKNSLQNQLTQAQKELDGKKDYDAIKAERDQLKQQMAEIVNKLGLASGATDKQVKDKITELMNRPTGPGSPTCSHTDYDSIKSERDRLSNENTQLKDENKKLKEKKTRILSDVTNLEKNGIKFSDKDKEKINNADTAEKIEEVRSEIIGGKFNELKGKNDNSIILNIGLGVLAIGSLLILGWVLMRQTNLPQTEPEKEKKK